MNNSYFLFIRSIFLLVSSVSGILNIIQAQVPNANSFSSQVNYNGNYRYGVNQGYFPGWTSENTATIAAGSTSAHVKGVGVKSFRVPLYDDFLSQWGLTVEVSKFNTYANLGADDNTAFVGSPNASHRDPTTYPGSPEQSKTFKNLYEPIWLDAAQTQINPNNYYAKYLYDVVNTYGSYIKFWEVVNEPDFTYSSAGWQGDMNPPQSGSWFDHNPTPEEMVNFRAPFTYYIRMLRISWEVIKKLQPNDYVCVGGIGYRGFLDAILRNTDNPADGSVTSNYPNKGGAYFDVVSYHIYPMYSLGTGSRHSDQASAVFISAKTAMDNLAAKYGYNGSNYPRKQFICTETGVSRVMSGANWGSNEGQKNYVIKASVLAQKNAIRQVYWIGLGDGADGNDQYQRMGLYYYFGGNTPYNQTPSDQGKAMKTTSDLLYNKTYDAARTASLNLPSSVDGGAFRASDGSYTYILWAKTSMDLSEAASANYSFPFTVVSTSDMIRKEWDYSETNNSATISKSNIVLTGTPSFFNEGTTSTTPPPSSSTSTSSRIEAENWSGVSAGPQTENTQDAGGGKDVGWISNGSWMDYSVTTSSAGSYTISFRVATPYTGSQLQVMSGGSVLTTVRVPFTGGFQNWQTVTATINLNAGTQTLRIQSTSNEGFNFNWFELSAGGSTSSTPPPSSSTSTSSRIEAENWSGVSAGPQTENTQDAGGGKDVGWISNGSWMDYSVTTSSAGSYTISFRVATPYTGSQLQVMSGGSVLTTVRVPFTGGFQNWQTVTATINLNAGTQTLRIQSTSNEGFNFNWFELSAGGSTSSTPPPSSSTSTSSRIEAENWSGVSAGPQTENTQDAGGGKDVGWISNGSWMDYSVTTSSAGSYTISFRVATPYTGSQLQVMSGGSVLTTVRVPFTGGFQNWQTVTATINLNAGTQTLRIQSTSNEGFNFNWFELSAGGSTSSTPPPSSSTSTSSRIEAENWSGVSAGPQTENTQDAGGGKDVGWISNGSWMDYSVTTSSAGSYTISFRVATPYTGSQLQVMSGGSVLTTVRVPFTGGFQNWQTVTATINLNAGTQTLRIQSTSNEGFNFNWFELSAGGSIVSVRTVQTAEVSTVSPTTSTSMVVYPNPVTSAFQLRVDNELTGSMTVQVIDMQGRVQKQFALTKAATGTSQFYLSIGELPKATYVLKATMNDWNQSTQIIKQ